MQKTVVEMFAGVGGFRCGLNHILTIEDASKPEKWETVWFSQWEPADKKIQWAHSCYVNRFGNKADLNGDYTTNDDIHSVDKSINSVGVAYELQHAESVYPSENDVKLTAIITEENIYR